MRHASLFTGIGGFDLAADWMGWQNVFQVEIDKWCQRLLAQNFPHAERYTDIKEFDGRPYHGTVDVLSGGFPCQPYSTAGKRLGKNDDRHLWPEMLRVIREVSPRWVVGENVRGLTNWNGGVVFEEVQADLEAEGYEVLPFLLPAAGVNAPHRRDRIWIVAYSESARVLRKERIVREEDGRPGTGLLSQSDQSGSGYDEPRIASYSSGDGHRNAYGPDQNRCKAGKDEGKVQGKYRERIWSDLGRIDAAGATPDTYSDKRSERGLYTDRPGEATGYTSPCAAWASGRTWENFPTQSPVCSGNDGISDRLDAEAIFDDSKRRSSKKVYDKWVAESLKGAGNAVVPQVVLQIFKAIEQYELLRIPS